MTIRTIHIGSAVKFAALWSAGQAMTAEEALLAEEHASIYEREAMRATPLPPPLPPQLPSGLTPREGEVLNLVARGMSNSRIAEHLVLSPHTVSVHVQSIYGKLGVNSRSAATRFALEHHLS